MRRKVLALTVAFFSLDVGAFAFHLASSVKGVPPHLIGFSLGLLVPAAVGGLTLAVSLLRSGHKNPTS